MDKQYEKLLKTVLDKIVENNRQVRTGTPMAELKDAIESAITSLPPLEFEEFSQAVEDKDAAKKLVEKAPEMIGWDADHLVKWIENLAGKL